MNIIKPPQKINESGRVKIFLAGSIEMGQAEDWQGVFAKGLGDLDVDVYNPRRDNWDSSWEQSIDNKEFRGQVEWELFGLETSDIIVMYLDPSTKSPISLLELGLFAKSGKLAVCCPEGFWRKGNVEVVCQRYNIPLFERLENLIEYAKGKIQSLTKA